MSRTLPLLALLACDSGTSSAPDPMARYASPTEMRGATYAGCAYTAYDVEDRIVETGQYDAVGNLGHVESCFIDEVPFAIHDRTYDGPHLIREIVRYESDLTDGIADWTVEDDTSFRWDGDLLAEREGDSFVESYSYDARGRRLDRVLESEDYRNEEAWWWDGTRAADIATAGAPGIELSWDEAHRLVSWASGGYVQTWTWDGPELVESTSDGAPTWYGYEEGRRMTLTNGEVLWRRYEWSCL